MRTIIIVITHLTNTYITFVCIYFCPGGCIAPFGIDIIFTYKDSMMVVIETDVPEKEKQNVILLSCVIYVHRCVPAPGKRKVSR